MLATVMTENYQSLTLGSHKPPEVRCNVSKTAPRSLVNINIAFRELGVAMAIVPFICF